MTPSDAAAAEASHELACTSCRNRKLKCDRVKPACGRCSRIKGDCVYPESRRKPAFKRRNVRELEARLAQVEGLLKQHAGDKESPDEEQVDNTLNFDFSDFVPSTEDVFLQGMDYTFPSGPIEGDPFLQSQNNPSVPLGANQIFFDRQQHFIPVIHPARYMQAYYSAPHMKPPMCLQYAIWALASNGHPKYGHLHDVFYQRARQYAEADELKGHGEHFITVHHAQAWSLITTDEAKSMLFTRAAMSSARAVRLANMMGLQQLDTPNEVSSPTLMPPKDWAELEERRRTFWGIFCLDSHCAISTGWPHLIDPSEVTTHLPASETAFVSGVPATTCTLEDAFKGASYSSFAGAILVCHLFNMILKHVHRPKPDDNPQNYEYGEYWKRHREIDNAISSAFMFLPEHFRLPENYGDPTAVHTNLNYHAALICLHLAALEKIEKYQIPIFAKKASETRLFTAAQEIVNIIKMTSHMKTNPRSPMAAISLYCAAMVFIYQCKDAPTPQRIDNLDFIISAMDAIGREHVITRAFLKQLLLDIDRNNITQITRVPKLDNLPEIIAIGNHNIPLLTRSQFSSHSKMQPPLPGRLPLGNPQGNLNAYKMSDCGIGFGYKINDNNQATNNTSAADETTANKRKRSAPSDDSGACAASGSGSGASDNSHHDLWGHNNSSSSSSDMTPSSVSTTSEPPPLAQHQQQGAGRPTNPFASFDKTPWAGLARTFSNTLPVRTGSPAAAVTSSGAEIPPSAAAALPTPNIPQLGRPSLDSAGVCMYAQFSNTSNLATGGKSEAMDGWPMVGTATAALDWDAIASSVGLNMGNFPGVLNPSLLRGDGNGNGSPNAGTSTNPG
ncbi:hypothetical protein E8E14_013711 [Neopestalotiopsis sp. 37M]|nr:hypothetical protein E8E14_013711 [Neopestalotiopsis sp. 37M]